MEPIEVHNRECATLKRIEEWTPVSDDTVKCPVCGELVKWMNS